MKDIKLVISKTYQFTHTRKGIFRAQLIDIVKASPDDEVDSELLCVKIDTRKGSGQERLARTTADVHVTNIRPSLITHIELLPDDSWLMETRVQEEIKREQRQLENDQKNQVISIAKTIIEEMEKNKKPSFLKSLFSHKKH